MALLSFASSCIAAIVVDNAQTDDANAVLTSHCTSSFIIHHSSFIIHHSSLLLSALPLQLENRATPRAHTQFLPPAAPPVAAALHTPHPGRDTHAASNRPAHTPTRYFPQCRDTTHRSAIATTTGLSTNARTTDKTRRPELSELE
jgi:hypothetical protein